MNGIEFIVAHHVPAKAAQPKNHGGGMPPVRHKQAEAVVALIRKEGRALTRLEIKAALGIGKTATRNVCNIGEEMGLLKQSRSGLSEQGVFTYWIDLA